MVSTEVLVRNSQPSTETPETPSQNEFQFPKKTLEVRKGWTLGTIETLLELAQIKFNNPHLILSELSDFLKEQNQVVSVECIDDTRNSIRGNTMSSISDQGIIIGIMELAANQEFLFRIETHADSLIFPTWKNRVKETTTPS